MLLDELRKSRCRLGVGERARRSLVVFKLRELASHTLKVAQEMKARLFPTGTRVRVRGLVAKPEYNSKTARVVAFDARSSRYRVVLDDGKQLLVKAACLERDV